MTFTWNCHTFPLGYYFFTPQLHNIRFKLCLDTKQNTSSYRLISNSTHRYVPTHFINGKDPSPQSPFTALPLGFNRRPLHDRHFKYNCVYIHLNVYRPQEISLSLKRKSVNGYHHRRYQLENIEVFLPEPPTCTRSACTHFLFCCVFIIHRVLIL